MDYVTLNTQQHNPVIKWVNLSKILPLSRDLVRDLRYIPLRSIKDLCEQNNRVLVKHGHSMVAKCWDTVLRVSILFEKEDLNVWLAHPLGLKLMLRLRETLMG